MNTYSVTNPGRHRPNNQDAYSNYFHNRFSLLLVADGMGGHNAGEVASRIAASEIQRYVINQKKRDDYENLLKEAVWHTNALIFEKAKTEKALENMGTTVVAAIVTGNRAIIAHVGDSRAYLFRNGKLKRLTEDHSLVADLIRRGLLTEEDAKVHPERSVITRAVGAQETVETDIGVFLLEPNDKLLLTTDGLTGMVTDDELLEIVTDDLDIKQQAQNLVKLANEHGGMDNITVTLHEYRSV